MRFTSVIVVPAASAILLDHSNQWTALTQVYESDLETKLMTQTPTVADLKEVEALHSSDANYDPDTALDDLVQKCDQTVGCNVDKWVPAFEQLCKQEPSHSFCKNENDMPSVPIATVET